MLMCFLFVLSTSSSRVFRYLTRFKMDLEEKVKSFATKTDEDKTCSFPNLNSVQRKQLYQLCEKYRLAHTTTGQGATKSVTVSRSTTTLTETKAAVASETDVRQQFVRDSDAPSIVVRSPYWEQLGDLLDPYYSLKSKFASFQRCVEQLASNNLHRYRQQINEFKEFVINKVKQHPDYKRYNEQPLPVVARKGEKQHDKVQVHSTFSHLYQQDHHDKFFVSNDLISANFNAIYHFYPQLFHGAKNWSEFLALCFKEWSASSSSSPLAVPEFLSSCKPLRQYILGHLNPSRQRTLYTKFIASIQQALMEHKDFQLQPKEFVAFLHDELVISLPDDIANRPERLTKHLDQLSQVVAQCCQFARVECFHLRRLGNTPYYAKEVWNADSSRFDKVLFKCIPVQYLPQCVRFYLGQPVQESDLMFMYEDYLCQFKESVVF